MTGLLPVPDVQPSLGEMALIQGMAAAGYSPGYSAGISFIKEIQGYSAGISFIKEIQGYTVMLAYLSLKRYRATVLAYLS